MLFLINLMKGFADADFFVLGVSTKPLSPDMAEPILAHCHGVIERFNIGFDFGSYQMGLRWIEQNPLLKDIDTLVLANDSLFYPSSIASTIRDLLKKEENWIGLFENFELRYHVQSFFEVFRAPVFKAKVFKQFWSAYKPYSSRLHTIHKGEGGLSRELVKAGISPAIIYSGEAIKQKIMSHFSSGMNDPTLSHILSPEALRNIHLLDKSSGRSAADHLAFEAYALAKTSNPTHTLGLLCNFLFEAPIKFDIVYRGAAKTADVVAVARGFRADELRAMKHLLDRKGTPTPVTLTSWHSLKRAAGVIQ
jgi:hypothetical protein